MRPSPTSRRPLPGTASRTCTAGSGPLLALVSSQSPQKLHGIGVPGTIAAWNQYWGLSPPGIAKLTVGTFDGQALRSKAAAAPQSLWPADYRRTFPGRGAWSPIESRLEGANTRAGRARRGLRRVEEHDRIPQLAGIVKRLGSANQ